MVILNNARSYFTYNLTRPIVIADPGIFIGTIIYYINAIDSIAGIAT
jgi:hypothetical protein